MSSMNRADQRAYQEWLDTCERIRNQTTVYVKETPAQKTKRIDELKGDFVKFCKYYFSHFMDSEFGWFHKKAAKAIVDDPNCFAILEWAREHAKSVFADVMMPMFLYARGELSGMVVASANEDKAITLLSDVQAQFEANQLWIHDFGNLVTLGDWQSGNFSTKDGIGFWAFGRGQSPRGIRKAAKRPNYAVVDDIDDKVIVRNDARVKDAVEWILEDLYGALSIKGARLVIAGNRIHKKSILAHLVGDVEPGAPKRKGITHIKVFAIENNRHGKADIKTGKPAWKERYTLSDLAQKIEKMGYRSAAREFFHEHIEDGLVFKDEWINWREPLLIQEYDQIEVYCDPSFKDTKRNDYKAVVTLGRKGTRIDIIDAWVRQTSTKAMVGAFYDLHEKYGSFANYRMEANFMQDTLLADFDTEAELRGVILPLRPDKRSKPNKYQRIESVSPLFERGFVGFNIQLRNSPDMITLVEQFLAFGNPAAHDDGPDAFEGGYYFINRANRQSSFEPRTGGYANTSSR